MADKKPTSHIIFDADPHSGRDEMNLAGHPFALLQSPRRQSDTSIYYEWPRTVANRSVTASWRVETPAAFGLPGPEEELLYLVLLQLTREAAENEGTPTQWPMQVKFSRREVLARMGWDNSSHRYAALETAFERLTAVTINAKYAFYDARTGQPINAVSFHILNEFSIVSEPRGRKSQNNIPLSHFEWNTTLHTSFLSQNVRSLALDFAISLDHPTSRRLFRLLEVLRNQPKGPPLAQLRIGLNKLRDRMGMTQYKYPSKIAEKIAPAVAELTARGYLAGMDMEKAINGGHLAVFRFGDVSRAVNPILEPSPDKTLETPPRPSNRPQSPFSDAIVDLSALLPDFSTPSSADNEESAAELDAIFEALPKSEKDAIDARAWAAMASFLRDHPRTKGAQLELQRARRREARSR